MAKVGENCHNTSTWKSAFGGPPPRDQRSRSSDREMPQFQPRIPHRQGRGRDACPNCGVLTLDGGRVRHGPWGWASIWAGRSGRDRTSRTSLGTHRRAGVCRGARAHIEVKEASPVRTATPLPPSNHPTPPSRWSWWLVFGTVITVQLGSEASGSLVVAMRATPDGVDSSAASASSGLFFAILYFYQRAGST